MAKQPSPAEEKQPRSDAPVKSSVNLAKSVVQVEYKPSIPIFCQLIEENFSSCIRLNVMTNRPELYDQYENIWREWTDRNDAQMRSWFQEHYGLYHERMLRDAMDICFGWHQVNPLTDLLESLVWDGKSRIPSFLHDTMRCDDTPYYREVSRLIFAGGIWRAFRPGCKFDDMIVLVGEQASGKSTIARWLNMNDAWFRELKVINGKESVEAMRGAWIIEVAELMAMTRVKEAEAVKAFVTAQEDSYRMPYERYASTIPRRCTFIGTTNNAQFLSDRTGNRRFYPVQCRSSAYELRSREKEVREYISQCWAEALTLFRQEKLAPFADPSVLTLIRKEQENAMEDDWRVGAITDYLDQMKKASNASVSIIELWHRALKMPEDMKPSRKDSIEIAQIMNSIRDWKRSNSILVTPWGRQKVYKKEQPYFPF